MNNERPARKWCRVFKHVFNRLVFLVFPDGEGQTGIYKVCAVCGLCRLERDV